MKYWYLCIITFILMALFIKAEHDKKYVLAVILKGLASLGFVIFGYLSSKMCYNYEFLKWVKIGLLLGMIADIMLNLRFCFTKGKIFFLIGILVFLAGHIMYIIALLPVCQDFTYIIVFAVIATALLLRIIFSMISAPVIFKIFGVFYIGTIVFMNCLAINNMITIPSTGNAIFVVGALSFLISDIVLIINTFGKKTRFDLRITNLSMYYLAQLLIAFSLQYVF